MTFEAVVEGKKCGGEMKENRKGNYQMQLKAISGACAKTTREIASSKDLRLEWAIPGWGKTRIIKCIHSVYKRIIFI